MLEAIVKDQKDGIEHDISVPGKASSYTHQHINEQINYLELANLIRVTEDKRVILNPNESEAISLFTSVYKDNQNLMFMNMIWEMLKLEKNFNLNGMHIMLAYLNMLKIFKTSSVALLFEEKKSIEETKKSRVNLTEFGDEGENTCI